MPKAPRNRGAAARQQLGAAGQQLEALARKAGLDPAAGRFTDPAGPFFRSHPHRRSLYSGVGPFLPSWRRRAVVRRARLTGQAEPGATTAAPGYRLSCPRVLLQPRRAHVVPGLFPS
jgi:hypothetical protein